MDIDRRCVDVAYDARLAAALSGATLGRLHYWRTPQGRHEPVLVPEVSPDPVLYSFRDIVALRTCVYLREQTSLQKIRKAIASLRELGETRHVSEYKLVSQQGGRTIVLVHADGRGGTDLVSRPGQQVVVVEMSDVLRQFPLDDVEVPPLLAPRPRLVVDPEVRGGHPVIKGTRVPFEVVADLVRDNVPLNKIRDFYPSVTALAARDAADFADYVDLASHRTAS
jgi:uncharacterized protein (DUF433 family)